MLAMRRLYGEFWLILLTGVKPYSVVLELATPHHHGRRFIMFMHVEELFILDQRMTVQALPSLHNPILSRIRRLSVHIVVVHEAEAGDAGVFHVC
jgi:hypothetical protein